jgi:hypothetical protein
MSHYGPFSRDCFGYMYDFPPDLFSVGVIANNSPQQDLGLAVSDAAQGQEFHVLLILIIMILTVFFCHSTIRLCMLIMRPNRIAELHPERVPSRAGPLGYAQPEQPIPVVLARDEEIAAPENSEAPMKVAPPPPAYGLWRSSVVSISNIHPRQPRGKVHM